MQVTTEQPDPCTLVLDVNIDEAQVARAFDSSYREFGKYANVPGFRPGKAPRAIVERYVDADRVRQHTVEKLIRETYPQIVEEQGVEPFRNPEFDPSDLEDKKSFSYKCTIPLEPQVTLSDYTGITVEKPLFTVTDDMVEKRLQELREEHARFERVNDRAAETGDMLIVEMQTVNEGDADPAPARRQLLQFGRNIPGFDEQIVGLTVGEEKSFSLNYPDDFENEDLRGKGVTYNLKVSSISARRLPELDDAFAKDAASVDTLEELKTVLRQSLVTNADRASNEIAEQRIIEKILETSEIHFPAAILREEIEERYRRLSVELRQNAVSYAQYLQYNGLTEEEHQQQVARESQLQLSVSLALREIARQEGLQPDNDAIEAEFARLLSIGAITQEQHDEYLVDDRRRFQVANALIQQLLHDFLFASNTIVEVEQSEEAPEAE